VLVRSSIFGISEEIGEAESGTDVSDDDRRVEGRREERARAKRTLRDFVL